MNTEGWSYCLAALFILAGIGMAFVPKQAKRFVSKIRSWPQVAANVINIEEHLHDVKFYLPKCEYTIQDKSYLSNPKHEYPYREEIPKQMLIFVNPQDSRDIYCERDLIGMQAASPTAYLMAACFVFAGFGLLMYLQFFSH